MVELSEQQALAREVNLGRRWGRERRGPLASAALYGVMLLLFFLPFISVSCDQVETESMSGVELLRGEEPSLNGKQTASEAEDLRDSVRRFVSVTRVLFMAIVVALLMAVSGLIFRESIDAAFAMLLSALGVLSMMFIFLGTDFDPTGWGPETHHKPAFILLVLLAFVQVILAYNIFSLRWKGKRSDTAMDNWLVRGTFLAILLTFVFGIGLLLAFPVFVVSLVGLRTTPNVVRLGTCVASLLLLAFVLSALA